MATLSSKSMKNGRKSTDFTNFPSENYWILSKLGENTPTFTSKRSESGSILASPLFGYTTFKDVKIMFKDVKHLGLREWTCPNCGVHHDRDVNAGLNLKQEAERILASSTVGTTGVAF